ncbi:Coiled-coil domain-containing protein 22 [Blattella germanica]|nr:Coiled-coil domain-containing protein 22 [Blattella germanica]
MEEVDNIIIHSLRQVGCDIEEEIDSLKHFSTDLVIEAAVRCLDVIQPGLGLPHSLPDSMSARFRVGASIAQACKNLGYSGDIGYQTFLYSSETDVRRVFMFLIEKLPKESEKSIVEPTGRVGILEKRVSETVKRQLTSPWLPRYCRRRGIRWHDDNTWSREGCGHVQPFLSCSLDVPKTGTSKEEYSQALREYWVRHLPLVTDQVMTPNQLVPSLITLNARGLIQHEPTKLNSRFVECVSRSLDTCSENTDLAALQKSEVDRTRAREESAPQKSQEASEMPRKAEPVSGAERKRGKEEEMQLAREETERLRERLEALQLDVKKMTAKLSQVIEDRSSEERVVRDKEERQVVRKRTYDLLPDADANIAKLQALVESSAQKLVGLAAQWEKHRAPLLAHYRDARQRNSNRADAKKDETAKRAYKLLATLHSDCGELVQMVEETGATVREIRDLEEQIETESAKNVGANLERISADLRQMKQETAALTAQLNAKS